MLFFVYYVVFNVWVQIKEICKYIDFSRKTTIKEKLLKNLVHFYIFKMITGCIL